MSQFLRKFLIFRLNRKGQHVMEYAMILTVIIGAIIVMRPYVLRSWNAHVKGWEDSVYDSYHDRLIDAPEDSIHIEGCHCDDYTPVRCGPVTSSATTNPPNVHCELFQLLETRHCTPQGCEQTSGSDTARCITPIHPPCCANEIVNCSAGNPQPTAPQRCLDPARDCGANNTSHPCPYGEFRQNTVCSVGFPTPQGCVPDASCQFRCVNDYVACPQREGGLLASQLGQDCSQVGYCSGTNPPQQDNVDVSTTDSCGNNPDECTVQCANGFVPDATRTQCVCPQTSNIPGTAWVVIGDGCVLIRNELIFNADPNSVAPDLLRIRSEQSSFRSETHRGGISCAQSPSEATIQCGTDETDEDLILFRVMASCEGSLDPTANCTDGNECGPDVCSGSFCPYGTMGCRFTSCLGFLPAGYPGDWQTLVVNNTTNPPTYSTRDFDLNDHDGIADDYDWVYTTHPWCEAPGTLTLDNTCYTRLFSCYHYTATGITAETYYDCDGNPTRSTPDICDNPPDIFHPGYVTSFGFIFYTIPIFLESSRDPVSGVPNQLERIYVVNNQRCQPIPTSSGTGEFPRFLSNSPNCEGYDSLGMQCVSSPNTPAFMFRRSAAGGNLMNPFWCGNPNP